MIKHLSQINFGTLNVSEKILSKPSGESMFAIHYDSIDSFVLILKIDLPSQILENNQIPVSNRTEAVRLTLSKEIANQLTLSLEGSCKIELSVFLSLTEKLSISEHVVLSNNKLVFHVKSQAILLDFFSLLLSFIASYVAIKLNTILLSFKNRDNMKFIRRTDPVPKVFLAH